MDHPVVPRKDWIAARKELLAREKEFTRLRDELSAARRALPWVKINKTYTFDTPEGPTTLAGLFDGRSQLFVHHFMFDPNWTEGCPSCSFWADTYNGIDVHLAHRDITLVAISRAPLEKLEAYKRRMGWTFRWVSSANSDFNFDYRVSFTPEQHADHTLIYNYAPTEFPGDELPGASVFYKNDGGEVFHTYSTYARGLDMLNAAYHHMDLTPKGRNEDDLPYPMAWVRRHDQYEV